MPIPVGESGASSKAASSAAFLGLAIIAAVSVPPVPTAAVKNTASAKDTAAVKTTAAEETGAVTGLVRLTAPARRLNTTGAYPSRRVTLSPQRAASELENVVVFVRRARPEPPAPTRVEIRQVNEEFVPHLVTVTTGSTVEFPNDDLVFHNVFSLSSAATFDLGRYPQRTSKARAFSKPGIVKVFCHLHSHMSAIVRVFDHPYFARLDAERPVHHRRLGARPA